MGVELGDAGPASRERMRWLLRQPYSRDTTPAAQAFLNERVRRMSPLERARRASELNQAVRDMAVAGHLARDPSLTPRAAKLLVIRGLLGDELFSRAYDGRAVE